MSVTREVFQIPLLIDQPAMGAGCCAVPAEDIIRSGLDRLDGVVAVTIDQPTGWVTVDYDLDRLDADLLVEALAGIGYPVASSGRPRRQRRGGSV